MSELSRRPVVDHRRASADVAERLPQEAALYEMLEQRPELLRYVNPGTIAAAKDAYGRIRQLILQIPQLVQQLNDTHARNPDHVAMLIIPEYPLIVARSSRGITAIAPVLTCTLNAIDHLLKDEPMVQGRYSIVDSDFPEDFLVGFAWTKARENPRTVLNYDPERISAADYAALAVFMFSNEVFRMSLSS